MADPTTDLDALVARMRELHAPDPEEPGSCFMEYPCEMPKLLDAIDALRTRLAQMETDIRDAAGELRVEMPQPGTVTAKLLSANVLLRRERDAARRWRDEAVAACAQRGCASRERRLTEAVVERDAAQARVRALAEAVERFEGIGHVADCDRDIDENKCDANPLACPGTHRACTCGWSDVEAALDALAAPERGDG